MEEKLCYDCKHCQGSHFCGWTSYYCKIYGSLDIDQKERHPEETAKTCPNYEKPMIEKIRYTLK